MSQFITLRSLRAFMALCTLFIVFTASAAPPTSRLSYAQQCAGEMGAIATFNCLDGQIIPITKNGQPVSVRSPGEQCDNPVQLGLGGDSQCVPYSRFLRIGTRPPDVETVVICRKYPEDDKGPSDAMFSDIAVVQHNKRTGNTCFFQSKLHQHLDGTSVPSPQENSTNASKYWLEPGSEGPGNIRCTQCHDADPFIWSKYIVQVADPTRNWNPLGKWHSNYLDLFGRTVKTFKPINNKCATCHRISSQSCRRDDLGAGHVSVRELADKRQMPPDFSGTDGEWRGLFEAAVNEIFDCCDNPSASNCATVDQQGERVPPPRRLPVCKSGPPRPEQCCGANTRNGCDGQCWPANSPCP